MTGNLFSVWSFAVMWNIFLAIALGTSKSSAEAAEKHQPEPLWLVTSLVALGGQFLQVNRASSGLTCIQPSAGQGKGALMLAVYGFRYPSNIQSWETVWALPFCKIANHGGDCTEPTAVRVKKDDRGRETHGCLWHSLFQQNAEEWYLRIVLSLQHHCTVGVAHHGVGWRSITSQAKWNANVLK